VVCSIERPPAGYEVRVGYSAEDILFTQVLPDLGEARDYAESQRDVLIKLLGLTESKGSM
jgi:hypothetical protein